MNGIDKKDLTNNQDLPLVKRQKQIQRVKVRFLLLILLTNMLTFLLTSTFNTHEVIEVPLDEMPKIQDSYTLVNIPLKNYANIAPHSFTDVTLMTSRKKVLIEHARIYSESINEVKSPFDTLETERSSHFLVEVPISKLKTLMQEVPMGIHAWPYHKVAPEKKELLYEIIF